MPLLTVLLLLLVALPQLAWSAGAPFHAWDVYYGWTRPSTLNSSTSWYTDVTMRVTVDPPLQSYYYFSHYTFFTDNRAAPNITLHNNAGMYTGLQTNGNRKSLIFSVWNGISGVPDLSPAGRAINNITRKANSYCEGFGGEGTGWHCLYTYNWKPNVNYRFRMALISRNISGDVIRGSMWDPKSSTEVKIGDIFTPSFNGHPSTSVYFYEYYGSVTSCTSTSQLPRAAMTFSKLGLTFQPTRNTSRAANVSSVYTALDGAGGGFCKGWATLDVCNTSVSGSSPAVPPLTTAPRNRCTLAT